jgi:hypothetical protein
MLSERLQREFETDKRLFWKRVRGKRVDQKGGMKGIKDVIGDMMWDENDVCDAWKEYFCDLLGSESDVSNVESMQDGSESACEPEGITRGEIVSAVKNLKLGKAPGRDGVTAKMLIYGGEDAMNWLEVLCKECWEKGSVPSDWKDAVLVPLYKGKGERTECKNHRGISLLSIPGKVFGRIIVRRIHLETSHKIWDVQCGFMSGRGCTDQMFSLKMIVDKYLGVNKKVFAAFVDLEKAYDRINRNVLWKVLREYGVNERLIRCVKAMYDGSRACVRWNGSFSEWFGLDAGVRQGCVMSPWLFNIYIDHCMRQARIADVGLKVGIERVCRLLYADDTVLMAESAEDLQRLLTRMEEECEKMGMRINVGKTKVVVFEKDEVRTECKMLLKGGVLEQVSEFTYLGRQFERTGKIDREIERRKCAGLGVIGALSKFAKDTILSRDARMAVYRSVLVPTLTYGCESWVWQEKHKSRIGATEMKYLRRVCGVTMLDRVRNTVVRERCNARGGVEEVVCKSMLRWFGHMERMSKDRLTKRVCM